MCVHITDMILESLFGTISTNNVFVLEALFFRSKRSEPSLCAIFYVDRITAYKKNRKDEQKFIIKTLFVLSLEPLSP